MWDPCTDSSATALSAVEAGTSSRVSHGSSSAPAAATTTRSGFFRIVTASATAAAASAFVVEPAHAAKYGSFGAGSPEVLDPSQADVDRDVLNSDKVQKALGKVRSYREAVEKMQALLRTDPQASVKGILLRELDVGGIRDTLNTVNAAFEEDTQRGTDRLIRVILQDITELETANNQKEGIDRSPRRLEIMVGKLAKLDKAFDDYLAFAK
jgi:hypothetical protein